jgi:hypothetical protein
LSLIEYYFQKKPNQDYTPHWGQIRDILKTLIESMDKRRAYNKSPTIEKGLEEERNHRLGACKKTLKKAM